jgi:hypothetical protein
MNADHMIETKPEVMLGKPVIKIDILKLMEGGVIWNYQ